MSVRDEARKLMLLAHAGQTRRDLVTPYCEHPIAVHDLLVERGYIGDILHAALLHDAVEDGDQDVDWAARILEVAGPDVLELVMWVTNTEWRGARPRRSVRKTWELVKLSRAPEEAQVLKLADRLANLRDAADLSSSFRSLYLTESRALLFAVGHADPHFAEQIDKNIRALSILP